MTVTGKKTAIVVKKKKTRKKKQVEKCLLFETATRLFQAARASSLLLFFLRSLKKHKFFSFDWLLFPLPSLLKFSSTKPFFSHSPLFLSFSPLRFCNIQLFFSFFVGAFCIYILRVFLLIFFFLRFCFSLISELFRIS